MRDHIHCRPHLDHSLGSRGAGAPKGNLNAAKTGQYTNPFNTVEISELADKIIDDPDQFVHHITLVAQHIHDRSGDALVATQTLRRFFDQMLPYLADNAFHQVLNNYTQEIPPNLRPEIGARLWNIFLHLEPVARFEVMRAVARTIPAKNLLDDNPVTLSRLFRKIKYREKRP